MSQDVQTVGANDLLRNLISHTNLISYTLFKCVLFREDSAPSMAQPKHPPLPFQLRNPGSRRSHLIYHTFPSKSPSPSDPSRRQNTNAPKCSPNPDHLSPLG